MSEQALSNWNRWGADDERGTLNYITPEVVKAASAMIRQGKVYSLAIPLQQHGVPIAGFRGHNIHLMSLDGGDYAAGTRPFHGGAQCSDDYIFMATHGTTHMDALAHCWIDNRLYNGFSSDNVRSAGARRVGIDKVGGVYTRGVLLDIAGFQGVEVVPDSHVITVAELEACARAQGVEIRSGDALLFRTGWQQVYHQDPHRFEECEPGIGLDSVPWLHAREVALVGSDNFAVEVKPAEDGKTFIPVHVQLLRNLGMPLMELLNLDELAADKVYEFVFVAAPLRITKGVGSPLNPLAVA